MKQIIEQLSQGDIGTFSLHLGRIFTTGALQVGTPKFGPPAVGPYVMLLVGYDNTEIDIQ